MNAKHRGPTFVAEIDQVRETARLRAGAAIHAARQAAQQGDQRAAKTLLDQAMHEVRGKNSKSIMRGESSVLNSLGFATRTGIEGEP